MLHTFLHFSPYPHRIHFADVDGAYPMINQQFVQHECTDYAYINREDDAGSAGLRKAKLSYQPAFMVQKGFVTKK